MVGRTISKYRIVEKVGQGGVGHVYKAIDTTLNRPVAIKFLSPHVSDSDDQVRRFEQEAMAISSLQHPNIAVIHDMQQFEGERFIVFEFLAGGSLRDRIRQSKRDGKHIPIELVVKYGVQICSALEDAHQHGIVHRDIKAANVMLERDDWVKLTDFGVAQLQGSDEHITLPGNIVGTVAYMAPEQASGETADARSDVFSTGVLLYELATLRLPFRGASAEECRRNILNAAPVPPRQLRPGLPDALERTILRALDKNPAKRLQTAAGMRTELETLERELEAADGDTATATRTMVYTDTSVGPRRTLLWVVVAMLAVAAILAAWFLTRHRLALPAQKKIAVLKFQNIANEPSDDAFCTGLMDMLASQLTELERDRGSLSVVPATEVRSQNVHSAGDAWRALRANLAITGSLERSSKGTRLTANLVDAKNLTQLRSRVFFIAHADAAAMQDGILTEIATLLDLHIQPRERAALAHGESTVPGAYDFCMQGYGYLASLQLDHAITEFQHALNLDKNYALAYAGLGAAYWRKYNATKDKTWVDRAWQACNMATRLNSGIPQPHVTLATLYSGTGRYEDALAECDTALRIDNRNRDAHDQKAVALERLNRVVEAETEFQKAIQLRPDMGAGYMHLGAFYVKYGRYAEAESAFRHVTDLLPDSAPGWANLGAVYHMQGREGEAQMMFQRAIAIAPTAANYSNLGTVYFFEGRYSDAARLFEKAIQAGSNDFLIWGNLGDAYRWSGAPRSQAAAQYRQAIARAQQELGVNPKSAAPRSAIGLYQAKLGDISHAIDSTEKALDAAPEDGFVLYRAAIVYELAGNRDRALRYLTHAIDEGYSKHEIMAESELRQLRQDPRFRLDVQK